MLYRIFIAVHLPEPIKKELVVWEKKLEDLPIRWTKEENLHFTLIFLGNTSHKELEEVFRICREVAQRYEPFSLLLNEITYGPLEGPPRMVWVRGESKEFLDLQKNLEDALHKSPILHFVPEKRKFTIHLTLGRIREWEFRKIEPEERPEIYEEISLEVPVRSIEVMESKLRRGGAEYTVLQSFPLAPLR